MAKQTEPQYRDEEHLIMSDADREVRQANLEQFQAAEKEAAPKTTSSPKKGAE